MKDEAGAVFTITLPSALRPMGSWWPNGAVFPPPLAPATWLPNLRVGLHLVVIEGPAVLPPSDIPDLVDAEGQFPSDQFRLGMKYCFRPRIRRQLAAEIRAQFAAFAATGLTLHHADAHKHMHLHPVVGRLMLDIGREFGLSRVRVPAEPPSVLAACGTRVGLGGRALYHWSRVLRRQVRAAGMATTYHCFGIAWSGHMTPERIRQLMAALPEGESEVYFPCEWSSGRRRSPL